MLTSSSLRECPMGLDLQLPHQLVSAVRQLHRAEAGNAAGLILDQALVLRPGHCLDQFLDRDLLAQGAMPQRLERRPLSRPANETQQFGSCPLPYFGDSL